MSLKVFKVITSFMLIYLVGCSSQPESRINPELIREVDFKDSLNLVFSASDTLIMYDFLIGTYLDYQTIVAQDTNYLVGINLRDHALDVINLTLRVSDKKIEFQSEGPNGLAGSIDGFFYHNADSIFILSIDENTIYLMDERAKKVDAFDFNQKPLPDGFSEYDAYADQGLMNGPYYNPDQQTLQFYTYRWTKTGDYSGKLFASYSIVDRAFKSVYGIYPDHFIGKANYEFYNDPGLLSIKNLSYVYFGTSPSIQVYDNNSGEMLFVSDYHCPHWPGEPQSLPANADFQKSLDWLTETGAYVFLLHDEKNKLIYRLMKRQQSLTKVQNFQNPRWGGEWCVDIFDEQLRPIGHSEIPSEKVLPAITFTANGNLWLKNPSAILDERQSLYYQMRLENTNDH